MSYTTALPRHAASLQRRRTRSRTRAAAVWMLKAAVTAALGVAGYLFVTAVAVPGLIAGIAGR